MKQFTRTQSISACACFMWMVFILCMPNHASAQQVTESLSSKSSTQHSFLDNADLFAGGFAQFTNDRINHTHDFGQGASTSPGILFRFHKSYRWWLGYDVNYGYTRFSENYFRIEEPKRNVKVPVNYASVQSKVNELTAAYRIHGRPFLGLIPYAESGIGEMAFSPDSEHVTIPGYRTDSLSSISTQLRLTGVYDVGLDAPYITDHLGARFEYRNLVYTAPTFKNWYYLNNDNVLMITQEAVGGMYVRF